MESIKSRQRQVQQLLEAVESQLFTLENKYLEETSGTGNVVRGWDGYIDSKPRSGLPKKDRRLKASDRIFSFSSVTSPLPSDDLARELSMGPSTSPTFKRSKSSVAGDKARKKNKRKRRDDDPDYGG